jgi:hypothetical protein
MSLCDGSCEFKSCSAPGLFYNYTTDGKVVTYNANSKIEKINASLRLSGGNIQQLRSQREALLRAVVDSTGKLLSSGMSQVLTT